MHDTIPASPMEPLPIEVRPPTDAERDRAADDVLAAFLSGHDDHGVEDILAEIMLPMLVASMRGSRGKGDGGLELAPGRELVLRACRRAVDGWDDADWIAYRR